VSEIGHNGGEPLDPFAAIAAHIADLNEEAKLHLDGKPVETQDQCDTLDKLYDEALKAEKAANDARTDEKKPHDDAAAAVQAKWKPLVSDAERIKKAARAGTVAWKQKLIDAANAKAKEIAELARAAQEAAQREAAQARADNDLGAIEASEQSLAASETLTKMAAKAAKPIATGLRTYWSGEVEDYAAYLDWLKANRLADLIDFMNEQVKRDVASGERVIPGVRIWSERR
jgi:hypothetical protein